MSLSGQAEFTLRSDSIRRALSDCPPRALAALCARCLRRVQPLFVHLWPGVSRKTLQVLQDAINCCDLRASKALDPSSLHEIRCRSATLSHRIAAEDAVPQPACGQILRAADASAHVALGQGCLEATVDAVIACVDALTASGISSTQLRRVHEDIALLGTHRLARDSPVPRHTFGRLWNPGDLPPWWKEWVRARPPRVFLSYSRADSARVTRIANSMSALGAEIWLDTHRLGLGAPFETEIEAAIEQCDFFAVLRTPSSLRSRWVKREVELAEEFVKKEASIEMLDVLCEDCDLPADRRGRVVADLRHPSDDEQTKLLTAVGLLDQHGKPTQRFSEPLSRSDVTSTGAMPGEAATPRRSARTKKVPKASRDRATAVGQRLARQLAKLPDQARTAFAARCLRRVQPLFLRHWPAAPIQAIATIDDAVDLVEKAAYGEKAEAADSPVSFGELMMDITTAVNRTASIIDECPNKISRLIAQVCNAALFSTGYFMIPSATLSGASLAGKRTLEVLTAVSDAGRHNEVWLDLDLLAQAARASVDGKDGPTPRIFGQMWCHRDPPQWWGGRQRTRPPRVLLCSAPSTVALARRLADELRARSAVVLDAATLPPGRTNGKQTSVRLLRACDFLLVVAAPGAPFPARLQRLIDGALEEERRSGGRLSLLPVLSEGVETGLQDGGETGGEANLWLRGRNYIVCASDADCERAIHELVVNLGLVPTRRDFSRPIFQLSFDFAQKYALDTIVRILDQASKFRDGGDEDGAWNCVIEATELSGLLKKKYLGQFLEYAVGLGFWARVGNRPHAIHYRLMPEDWE